MNQALQRTLERAGFRIEQTGGGCTAWVVDLPNDARMLLTVADDASHNIDDDEQICVGIYPNETDDDDAVLIWGDWQVNSIANGEPLHKGANP